MTIAPMTPLLAVDWEKVDFVRVTLESPFRGGGLRWRQGTTEAKRNLTFNAHDPASGPPWWPGMPVMYPEDQPALAGDPERESFLMPAAQAFMAFGHFYAPLEVPKQGIVGFTQGDERSRVAAFWHWYKMPPGDGTMHPPMNRLAAPDVPHVTIRPLTKGMVPLKADGAEIAIDVRAFWKFDDPSMYDTAPVARGSQDVAALLSGFTAEEIDGLRELLKTKAPSGKVKG